MNAEKDIVNIWLQRQGFFTIVDVNAKNRVVDILAVKQGGGKPVVRHVEVSCSVTSGKISEPFKAELLRKFNDANVVAAVKRSMKVQLGSEQLYEKVLVTTQRISLPNVTVLPFSTVFHEVVSGLDTQNYRSSVVRSLQLFKYILLADPVSMVSLLSNEGAHRPLTAAARKELASRLMLKDSIRKSFRKKESEQMLIELLRESTLRNPERLANALDSVLTKRTATRFLNVLLRQKNLGEAVKEEVQKDQRLQKFFS